MDTESKYMAISADSLEEIVRPELRNEFEAKKKEWLAWNKWSERTPGLFKLECDGSRMIPLCSKCCYVDKESGAKFSPKGVSKKQNDITWQRFKTTLEDSIDRTENRGFRTINGQIVT